jgi:hypothetical protein
MTNALIVRPRSDLLSPTRTGRAAQYVRMSTDHQRYSTQNQAAAIAVYAAQHDLVIVRTYADEGRSGLRIQPREGLMELIDDVRDGRRSSIIFSSTMSVAGADSRTPMRALITNSPAVKPG